MDKTCSVTYCRTCAHDKFEEKWDLGDLHPSGFMLPGEQWPERKRLCLVECKSCGIVQLSESLPPDQMYRQYWYRSGLNRSMTRDLWDVAHAAEKRVTLNPGDTVVDIGCNDGTLFQAYSDGVFKVGFDPALNLEIAARQNCDWFINDYFSAYPLKANDEKAKIITAIAMFYDLEQPHHFLEQVREILHKDGIFIIQFTDLTSMLKANAFDNICHEHLLYYTLNDVCCLLAKHGMEAVDVEYNAVNGGSLRVYAKHIALPAGRYSQSLDKALTAEAGYSDSIEQMAARVKEIRKLWWALWLERGMIFHALGASTKGNTLLQYFDITSAHVPYAAEINHDKVGMVTVGSNIHILSETDSIARVPPTYLVLPWHFVDTWKFFIERHEWPMLFFPLPAPRLLYKKKGKIKWLQFQSVESLSGLL